MTAARDDQASLRDDLRQVEAAIRRHADQGVMNVHAYNEHMRSLEREAAAIRDELAVDAVLCDGCDNDLDEDGFCRVCGKLAPPEVVL